MILPMQQVSGGVLRGGSELRNGTQAVPYMDATIPRCHSEAEGRGNLLEPCTDTNAVAGDCHVASLLAMTVVI